VVLLIGNDERVVVELETRRPEVVLELVAEPRGRGLRTWHRRAWVHSSPGPSAFACSRHQVVAGDRSGLWLAPVLDKATEEPVLGYRAAAEPLGVSLTTVNARVRQQAPRGQPGRLGKVGTVWWPSAAACRAWWERG